MLAVPGKMVGPKAVVDQCPDVGVGLDDDVGALAAVAAVGSPQRDVLLPAEAAAALAAVAADGYRDSSTNIALRKNRRARVDTPRCAAGGTRRSQC
jgi:hypothetical protein